LLYCLKCTNALAAWLFRQHLWFSDALAYIVQRWRKFKSGRIGSWSTRGSMRKNNRKRGEEENKHMCTYRLTKSEQSAASNCICIGLKGHLPGLA
jgi:hypothetical protein